jgi:membrane protease subunit (stomatin/prohibitin family)
MVGNAPVPAKGGSLFGATTVAWEDIYKGGNVMWRVPRNIRYGDNIVVREDEIAVFYRDGKALAYIDTPGRYGLTSMSVGIIGNVIQALSGVRQEAEVYYLQRKIFDGKFGSAEPYVFRDPDFGLVSLRVFGDYRWKVSKPDIFINQFVGTFGATAQADVDHRLRDQMVLLVYDTLGHMKEQGVRVTDLASQLMTIEQAVLGAAPAHFDILGVLLQQIQGLSINLPDDVQKAIDTRSSMGVLGVNYMQYQAGQALTTAAANPGGSAGTLVGAGVGFGAGMGMGGSMMGAMSPGMNAGAGSFPCPKCGQLVPAGSRFCPSCGYTMAPAAAPAAAGPSTPCAKCNTPIPAGSKFCPNCGAPAPVAGASRPCPKCQTPVPAGAKFCPNCANPMT